VPPPSDAHYCILRPGQVRGVPWLAPVMLPFAISTTTGMRKRMRKKTEACLAGIVTRPEGSGGLPIVRSPPIRKPGKHAGADVCPA